MGGYFLLGVVLLAAMLLAARAFTRASPGRLAQGVRAFIAAFSVLAGTGLLFAGRLGLALVTLGAAVMAVRAMKRAPGGFGGFTGGSSGGAAPRTSAVATDTLNMTLDHATGDLEGEVLQGPYAGRSLDSLGVSDLMTLLAWCRREDPRSVALLETYLDRRDGDWRSRAGADAGGPGGGRRRDRRKRDGRGDRAVDPRPAARRRRGRDQGGAPAPDDQAAPGSRRLELPRGPAQPGQGLPARPARLSGQGTWRASLTLN